MNATSAGRGLDLAQFRRLTSARRDDELAQAVMIDRTVAAIGIETVAPRDAQPCLQACRRIIDSGMNDFRIARTRLRANATGGFDDVDLTPGERQSARDRETDDASADDGAVHSIHKN